MNKSFKLYIEAEETSEGLHLQSASEIKGDSSLIATAIYQALKKNITNEGVTLIVRKLAFLCSDKESQDILDLGSEPSENIV